MIQLAGRACIGAILLWAALICGAKASGPSAPAILMTFWSDDTVRHPGNPMPGSVAASGVTQANPEMRRKLDAINVLGYGFMQVDVAGNLYFDHPAVDLVAGSFSALRAWTIGITPCEGSFPSAARAARLPWTMRSIIPKRSYDPPFRSFRRTISTASILTSSRTPCSVPGRVSVTRNS